MTGQIGIQNNDSTISGPQTGFGAGPPAATRPTSSVAALRVVSSSVEDVYVLGIDTVDFSGRSDNQQIHIFRDLLGSLAESETAQRIANDDVACLLTGDGVLFVVKGTGNRHVPLRLALALHGLAASLRSYQLRFGVNAGPAKWITLGDGSRQVIGHAVNWTARVMSAAEGGQVLASGQYYDIYLRGSQDEFPGYRFVPVYDLTTKKGEPVPAYEVADVRPR
jgi:class 3 adenylate cyclase